MSELSVESHRNQLRVDGKVRHVYLTDDGFWIAARYDPSVYLMREIAVSRKVRRDEAIAWAISVLKQYDHAVVYVYGSSDCTRKVDYVIDL